MTKRCDNCGYCILKDYGYSNYTVEGTTVVCSINAHPSGGFDRWYGRDHRLKHANECDHFVKDDPVHLDVDVDDIGRNAKGPDRWANYETTYVNRVRLYEILEGLN